MNEIHRQFKKSVEKLTKEKAKESIIDDVKNLLKTASKFINNATMSKFTKNFARHKLQSFKIQTSRLFRARSFLKFRQL